MERRTEYKKPRKYQLRLSGTQVQVGVLEEKSIVFLVNKVKQSSSIGNFGSLTHKLKINELR
jgi:hypothetical protein